MSCQGQGLGCRICGPPESSLKFTVHTFAYGSVVWPVARLKAEPLH